MTSLQTMALVQGAARDVSVVQALLLGLSVLITFVASVFTAGYVAQRIAVEDATYARALWATVFKNLGFLVVGGVFTQYVPIPFPTTALLVAGVIPVLIIRQVFLSTFGQATRIWIASLGVEIGVALILTLVSLSLGDWLETRYLTSLAHAASPAQETAGRLGDPTSAQAARSSLWWLWVPSVIALLTAYFWWRGGQPVFHRHVTSNGLRRFLEDFVAQLGLGSVLVIEHEQGPATFQFTVSDRTDRLRGLMFTFPERGWSQSYFDEVGEIAKRIGADIRIVPSDGQEVGRYLQATILGEPTTLVGDAHTLLSRVSELIALGPDAHYTVHARGSFNREYSREIAEQLVPLAGERRRARLIRRATRQDV